VLEADGVTLSPYLGEDAIAPFLAYAERIVYILARTSNPSAGTLQDVAVGAIPLYVRVASWVAQRWPEPRVGLVVGATAPDELASLRREVPGPAFLVPGVGAQGGDLATAVRACHGTLAPGLVNVSRGIAGASRGTDGQRAAGAAARSLSAAMAELGATLPA
jgi:orotidine-5'-phosphate decarboxylase